MRNILQLTEINNRNCFLALALDRVDIARKSGKKLNYEFFPTNNLSQFFSLNVKVNS